MLQKGFTVHGGCVRGVALCMMYASDGLYFTWWMVQRGCTVHGGCFIGVVLYMVDASGGLYCT